MPQGKEVKPWKVRGIRKALAETDAPMSRIAAEFGVARATVKKIREGLPPYLPSKEDLCKREK